MTRRQARAIALVLLVIGGHALAAEPAAKKEEKPKEPDWSNALKNIPIGPFRLDIGGSVRLRYEYQNDFNQQRYADERRGFSRDGFLLQRTRLDFNLRFAEQARLYVELQDARVYGSDFRTDDFDWRLYSCPYRNPLDLRQAYLEWLHIGGTPFGFKIGRQAIFYADNRIWGPGEWGNAGRYTWDAVKLIADTPLAEVHGILANRIRYDPHSFDEHDSSLDAYGIYAMLKGLPFRLDLFWLRKRTRPNQLYNAKGDRLDLDTGTVGFYVDGKLGKRWDYGGTLAHTFGDRKVLSAAGKVKSDDGVRAWGANARLGYTFDLPWQPRIGLEYSYGSGDARPNDGRYGAFDGAFGAIDAYYGRMNFLSWMNMHDYQLSLSARPVKKLKVSLDYHIFRLDKARDAWYWCSGRPARQDATGKAGRDLAQEIDLIVNYKYSRHWEFMAGYCHFFPGTFMKRTGASPDADWFFLQTQYSF